jgi:hypothetical protein
MKDQSNINFDSGGRSLSQILQEIVRHITEIFRSEMRLARAEVREDVTQVRKSGVYFVIGAVFAFHALGFFLLGLVYALGTTMALWLSALVVSAGAGVIAVTLLSVGRRKLKQTNLMPDKTIRSLQENVTWMKRQTK